MKTVKSKMNGENTIKVHDYPSAMKYLESLQFNVWHKFEDIPYHIRYASIDILDSGFKGNCKVIFDEEYKNFSIRKSLPYPLRSWEANLTNKNPNHMKLIPCQVTK